MDSVFLRASNERSSLPDATMSAKIVLTEAAKRLAAELKGLGYKRSGLRFVRQGIEVISLIELQVGRSSTPKELSFALNFGVIVISLADGEATKPTYTVCPWGGRVSGRDTTERWWTVRESDSVEELSHQLVTVVSRDVLPEIDSNQTEEALITLWRSGRSPGLVEAQRLLFLGVLLHRAGRLSEFAAVRSELESKARDRFSFRALEKLKGLES